MRAGCLLKLPSGGSACYAWDLWYSAKVSFTEPYRTPPPPWPVTELSPCSIIFHFFSGFQMRGFCFKLGLEQLFWWRSLLTECLLHSRLSIYASASSRMLLSCQACSSMWTGLHGERGGHVGWKRCLARAMRIVFFFFFVYGAKKDTEISAATGSVCQFTVRSIHICRDILGTCGHIVHWWDVSLQIDWFRIKRNYISRWSALSSYLCKCGNQKCVCTWKRQQRDCLVLPWAKAAPFELLDLWCPSSLLLGFRGRGAEMRCGASVKHRLKMRLALVIFWFLPRTVPSPSSPIHRPGFLKWR